MEIQVHSIHGPTGMFRLAEAAAQQVTEAHLRQAAAALEEAKAWVQLGQNLKYVLINVATGAVVALCRQHQHEIGLEVLRQPNMMFALPVGTRSKGYPPIGSLNSTGMKETTTPNYQTKSRLQP